MNSPSPSSESSFLSSNAQDFIEELTEITAGTDISKFLSSNAQDFIEEKKNGASINTIFQIPEQ